MPRRGSPYNSRYERKRTELLAGRRTCWLRLACDGDVATSADHDPPLALHRHVEGSGCCTLRPACRACQGAQAELILQRRYQGPRPGYIPPPSREW